MATFVLLMRDTDAAEAERAVARLQSAERMYAAKQRYRATSGSP